MRFNLVLWFADPVSLLVAFLCGVYGDEGLVKVAKHKHCTKIFSLSTRTGDWFIEQGFKEDNAESLPQSRQIEKSRGSKLYTLSL